MIMSGKPLQKLKIYEIKISKHSKNDYCKTFYDLTVTACAVKICSRNPFLHTKRVPIY